MLGLGKAVPSFGGTQNSHESISSVGMWGLQPLETDPVSHVVVVLDTPCSPLVLVVVVVAATVVRRKVQATSSSKGAKL